MSVLENEMVSTWVKQVAIPMAKCGATYIDIAQNANLSGLNAHVDFKFTEASISKLLLASGYRRHNFAKRKKAKRRVWKIDAVSNEKTEWLTVAEVTRREGFSDTFIRERLRRGAIRNEKRNGVIYLCLSDFNDVVMREKKDALKKLPAIHGVQHKKTLPQPINFDAVIDQMKIIIEQNEKLLSGLDSLQTAPQLPAPIVKRGGFFNWLFG